MSRLLGVRVDRLFRWWLIMLFRVLVVVFMFRWVLLGGLGMIFFMMFIFSRLVVVMCRVLVVRGVCVVLC